MIFDIVSFFSSPLLLLILCGVGMFSGFTAGLLGVGGGFVIVPVLFQVLKLQGIDFDVSMHIAIGTSLAIIVTTGFSSALSHFKHQSVNMDILRLWGPWFCVGVIIGSIIADKSGGLMLMVIFGFITLGFGLQIMIYGDTHPLIVSKYVIVLKKRPIIPSLIGLFSSMLGIGGGIMSVPVLISYGERAKIAVGTSAALGLFVAIPGTIMYMITGMNAVSLPPGSIGYVYVPAFLIIMPIGALFSFLGARVAHRIENSTLKRIFSILLLSVSIKMFYNVFIELFGPIL